MKKQVLVKLNSLELGGTQLNALDFASSVEQLGFSSVLVAYRETLPKNGPSLLDVAVGRGQSIELLDKGARPGEAGTWGTRIARARELEAFADDRNIDLVHSYSAAEARVQYWGPCRFGRRPHVITAYEMAIPRRVYPSPPLIVGARYLLDELSERRGTVHLISPPVDLRRDRPDTEASRQFTRSWGLSAHHLRIVIVSRLAEQMKARGIELAIQAMEALARRGVDLIVVGEGPAEERLRSQARRVNEASGRHAVVFTGAMADPRPAYAAADIVFGMGGSAARALAFGKPLVVMGEFGSFQAFTPETSVALFRSSFWSDEVVANPITALINLVCDLEERPERRVALGEYGRHFAVANFGLETMARRLADVYEEALEHRHLRAEWFADLKTETATIAAQLSGRSA